jgi:hypothetical protein
MLRPGAMCSSYRNICAKPVFSCRTIYGRTLLKSAAAKGRNEEHAYTGKQGIPPAILEIKIRRWRFMDIYTHIINCRTHELDCK